MRSGKLIKQIIVGTWIIYFIHRYEYLMIEEFVRINKNQPNLGLNNLKKYILFHLSGVLKK